MKTRFLNTIKKGTFALVCTGSLLSSCTKWDEFKKYTDEGEITYSGKLDSVKIYSGNERIKIMAQLPADPKIVKAKIFWNNNTDSVEVPIDITKGRSFSYVLPMTEGLKSFVLYTYDAKGNKSVPVYATGTALGSRYRGTIANRLVTNAIKVGATTTINWVTADISTNPLFTELKYQSATGEKVVKVPVNQDVTVVSDLASSSNVLNYRTAYVPSNSIDTFYTDSKAVKVFRDVTDLYLSNTGPFTAATLDGRWGTLASPWITNAAAKNKGGTNGGFTADEGGAINWETWFNTPVTNGKIYQPSAVPLTEGNYFVQFDQYSEIQSNSSVFCIVAPGGNGIPALADLNTALGSVALYNGVPIGATSPSVNNKLSFSFKITAPQVVSLGFLGNLGSSDVVGNYFRVKNIRLYSDN